MAWVVAIKVVPSPMRTGTVPSQRCASVGRIRTDAALSQIDCRGALRPRSGGWPLPAAGGRRPVQGTSDQTRFLQSSQGAKLSIPIWGPRAWLQPLKQTSESETLLSAGLKCRKSRAEPVDFRRQMLELLNFGFRPGVFERVLELAPQVPPPAQYGPDRTRLLELVNR